MKIPQYLDLDFRFRFISVQKVQGLVQKTMKSYQGTFPIYKNTNHVLKYLFLGEMSSASDKIFERKKLFRKKFVINPHSVVMVKVVLPFVFFS